MFYIAILKIQNRLFLTVINSLNELRDIRYQKLIKIVKWGGCEVHSTIYKAIDSNEKTNLDKIDINIRNIVHSKKLVKYKTKK